MIKKILNLILIFILIAILVNKLEAEENYNLKYCFYFDTKPLFLSLQTEGFGYGLTFEIIFNNNFSVLLKNEFFNFKIVDIKLIDFMIGARYYIKNAPYGFFIGSYFMILYGKSENSWNFLWGINVDFGYKFELFKEILKYKSKKLFIELYIEYNYVNQSEIIYGISPGISIGVIF